MLCFANDLPNQRYELPDADLVSMIREIVMKAGAARLLYVAAKLQIADLLAAGPQSSGALAARLNAHPATLHRLLRGWTACGILRETDDGVFALAPEGQPLRRDAENSQWYTVMEWGEVIDKAMGGLLHAVETGETPFDHVFGMSVWDYRAQHPTAGGIFHANVAAATARIVAALLQAYDFSDARCMVDVGGGQGALVGGVLQAHAGLRGVLYEKYPEARRTTWLPWAWPTVARCAKGISSSPFRPAATFTCSKP